MHPRCHRSVATFICLSLAWVLPLFAATGATDVESLRKENTELRQRLDKVEGELADIKKLLGTPAAAAPAPAAAVPAGFTAAETARLHELADPKKRPLLSSLDLKLYGYIKLDAAYDNSRTSVGNFARWVESEGGGGHDDQFSMTANQTRLGLDILGPRPAGVQTGGKVEIDFYGAGTAENKPEPMLRHAFLTANWADWDLGLLAGQSSDVISPLFLPTVNYTVGWWQGNIGYRRPQVRLTKGFALDDAWRAQFEVAATRTITGRRFVFTSSTDPDSGDDSGFPTIQSRASVSFPVGGKRRGTVGLSGHYGEEDQHVTGPGDHNTVSSWSINADLRVPVTDWLLVQAEGFVGENLDMYLGGIGQGIDPTNKTAVASTGGWVATSLGPWRDWSFNAGAGFDNPQDGDLTLASARTFNWFAFGNVQYSLTANLQLAFELSYLRTKYQAMSPGDSWREQLALVYKF